MTLLCFCKLQAPATLVLRDQFGKPPLCEGFYCPSCAAEWAVTFADVCDYPYSVCHEPTVLELAFPRGVPLHFCKAHEYCWQAPEWPGEVRGASATYCAARCYHAEPAAAEAMAAEETENKVTAELAAYGPTKLAVAVALTTLSYRRAIPASGEGRAALLETLKAIDQLETARAVASP